MTRPAEFTRRMIRVPDGEIAVLDFGDPARPIDVIFSNGNGFNAMCHRQALAPLADRLRIIAADQRGHGHTRLPAKPEGRTSWWDLSRDLDALMAALELTQPVVLAGHSMGGTISLMTTHALKAQVRRVVCFDPVLGSRPRRVEDFPPHLKALIAGTLRRRRAFASREEAVAAYKGRGVFATWSDAVLADYVADGFRDAPGGGVELACSPEWEASNYGAQDQNGHDLLANAPRPVLVFKATTNSTCAIKPEDIEARPHTPVLFETIEGTTHCLPMERPDVVERALLSATA